MGIMLLMLVLGHSTECDEKGNNSNVKRSGSKRGLWVHLSGGTSRELIKKGTIRRLRFAQASSKLKPIKKGTIFLEKKPNPNPCCSCELCQLNEKECRLEQGSSKSTHCSLCGDTVEGDAERKVLLA